MQVFTKPQDPKEELKPEGKCLKCASVNLAPGYWHRSGPETWLRLFKCQDCETTSAI